MMDRSGDRLARLSARIRSKGKNLLNQAPWRQLLDWRALGIAAQAAAAAVVLSSTGLPARLHVHLALWILAGALWVMCVAAIGLGQRSGSGSVSWIFAIALLARVPAWTAPPVHSDDVYRYLWDGATQQAGKSPYLGAPDAPVYSEVRAAQPLVYARINNRELPTIYPPLAQLGFALGARISRALSISGLCGWKVLVGLADMAVLCLLLLFLLSEGMDPRWSVIWAFSPLVIIEAAHNAHVDVLGVALVLGALFAWRAAGRVPVAAFAAGALLSGAALVKPLALSVLPSMLGSRRRLVLVLAGAAVVVCTSALPYAGRGAVLPGSLGEYGRRWRGNEGAYALMQRAVEGVLARAYRPPYHDPWRHPRLARLITGRERDAVWPDELAAFITRAVVLALLGGALLMTVRARLGPVQAGSLLLGLYLLLSPVLHPWYLLWGLMLAPLWPAACAPWLALALLAPLSYIPLGTFLSGAVWTEPVWTRALEHGSAWVLSLLVVPGALSAAHPPAGGLTHPNSLSILRQFQ